MGCDDDNGYGASMDKNRARRKRELQEMVIRARPYNSIDGFIAAVRAIAKEEDLGY